MCNGYIQMLREAVRLNSKYANFMWWHVCFRDVTLSSQPSAANCSSGELNSTSRSTGNFVCGPELKISTGITSSANTELHVFNNNTHYVQHPAWPRTNRKWPVTRLSVDFVFSVLMCIYLAVGGMAKIFHYSTNYMINCKHFIRKTAMWMVTYSIYTFTRLTFFFQGQQ